MNKAWLAEAGHGIIQFETPSTVSVLGYESILWVSYELIIVSELIIRCEKSCFA